MKPTINEILDLDALTLKDHTEKAGDEFDETEHKLKVQELLESSCVFWVRRQSKLMGYSATRELDKGHWIIYAFNLHPHSNRGVVMKSLLTKNLDFLIQRQAITLTSHVYKTNRLSIDFHDKLGFKVRRENEKAVEYHAHIEDIILNNQIFFRLSCKS